MKLCRRFPEVRVATNPTLTLGPLGKMTLLARLLTRNSLLWLPCDSRPRLSWQCFSTSIDVVPGSPCSRLMTVLNCLLRAVLLSVPSEQLPPLSGPCNRPVHRSPLRTMNVLSVLTRSRWNCCAAATRNTCAGF